MSEDNKLLGLIMDRLKENTDMVASMDKKLDLHIQETKYELKAIRDLDVLQNAILEEHHKRSDRLAEDNALREASLKKELEVQNARIAKLEKPSQAKQWWSITKKWLLIGGGIATATVAIYEAVKTFLGN